MPVHLIRAQQGQWPGPSTTGPRAKPCSVVIAGAGGVLGNEVTRRLLASSQFQPTIVLTEEPFHAALRGMVTHEVHTDDLSKSQTLQADIAVVMFEPGRMYYDREKALWTPRPDQLLTLGRWLVGCGVNSLIVVLPHQPNRLPQALQIGLASLDEQSLSTIGLAKLVVIHSAERLKTDTTTKSPGQSIAAWVFQALAYMIPSTEQPVRSVHLAEFVLETTKVLADIQYGAFACGQQLLNESVKHGAATVVRRWLLGDGQHAPSQPHDFLHKS